MSQRGHSATSRHLKGRQVHYRRAGSGAPVLLLHQTPAFLVRAMLPLMRFLAPRFTVIAPDMPGYGASDRLGHRCAALRRQAQESALVEPYD